MSILIIFIACLAAFMLAFCALFLLTKFDGWVTKKFGHTVGLIVFAFSGSSLLALLIALGEAARRHSP